MYDSERYLHVRIGSKTMWVKRDITEEEEDDPIVDDDDVQPVALHCKRLKKQPLPCIEIK